MVNLRLNSAKIQEVRISKKNCNYEIPHYEKRKILKNLCFWIFQELCLRSTNKRCLTNYCIIENKKVQIISFCLKWPMLRFKLTKSSWKRMILVLKLKIYPLIYLSRLIFKDINILFHSLFDEKKIAVGEDWTRDRHPDPTMICLKTPKYGWLVL